MNNKKTTDTKKVVHIEHLFGCVYGGPKMGKTTSLVRAFPSALFIAPKGGLNAANWLGIEPKHVVPQGIAHVIDIIEKTHRKVKTIVIDDASLLIEDEHARLLKECKGNTWDSYARIIPVVHKLRDVCRNADCDVWWSMHEQSPREDKNMKGGPLVPGQRLPREIATMFDFVGRVVHDEYQPGHPYSLQLGANPDWTVGWRGFEGPPTCRLNIGEFLRACGYDIPRGDDLEWMEKEVSSLSAEIFTRSKQSDSFHILDLYKPIINKLLKEGRDHRHIRLVCMDALDRASMHKYTTNTLSIFLENFEQEITL